MTQGEQQMTQYEKFRLKRLANRNQDDNLSAHFSNISGNISIYTKSERDINIKSFRSSNQNEEDLIFFKKQLQEKDKIIEDYGKKYIDLQKQYEQLLRNYKLKNEQAEKYRKLYEEQLSRERETKMKLKNWVKEAKTNLNN